MWYADVLWANGGEQHFPALSNVHVVCLLALWCMPACASCDSQMSEDELLLRLLQTATDQQHEDLPQQFECVICMERARSRMLRPCGHLCVCELCWQGLKSCPLCRSLPPSRLPSPVSVLPCVCSRMHSERSSGGVLEVKQELQAHVRRNSVSSAESAWTDGRGWRAQEAGLWNALGH